MYRVSDPELAGTSGFRGDECPDNSFEALMREEEALARDAQRQGSSPAADSSAALRTPRRALHQHGGIAVAAHSDGELSLQLPDEAADDSRGHTRGALIPAAGDNRHSGGLASLAARSSAKSPRRQDNPAFGTDSKRAGRRGGSGGRRGGKEHEPTVLGTILAAVVGTALAAAWFLTSAALKQPAAPACIVYQPAECLLQHGQPFQPPTCKPANCRFNATESLACPMAANGTFVRQRKAGVPCASAFLTGRRRRTTPPCSKACCDGDLRGAFLPIADGPAGAQQWQPRSQSTSTRGRKQAECSYFQFTSAEVLHSLQGSRVRILVVGDSLMRQLHARLVHMFRGTQRAVDYRVGGLARYSVCRAGDSFSVFEQSFDQQHMKPVPPKQLLPLVQRFAGRPPHATGCERRDHPIVIDYIHSTKFQWQQDVLQAYTPEVQKGERLIIILAVNAAEQRRDVSAEWMQYLESMSKDVKVIVVGTPTAGIANQETASVLAGRNKLLQAWAAARDAISFVNFDAMSRDKHRPPRAAKDVHWMCWLQWPRGGTRGREDIRKLQGANVLREPSTGVPVVGLHTTEDGACADEMNRNLWQVLFNIFMKHRWS